MITKFKIFENVNNFKPGDVVVSLRGSTKKYWNREAGLETKLIPVKDGKKYIVDDVRDYLISLRNYKTNKLIVHPDTGKPKYFFSNFFIPEYVWDSKKFNI